MQSIARTFGVNSKPFEIAAQRLHGHGFELYDKNGVVQIRNNAANRAKHQTIRSIANQRQSIQVLKRKYAPKNTGGQALGNTPESENDFWKWYGELSSEFENLYDEIYNYLAPACDICSIPLDFYKAFKDDDYRVGKWQDVFEKLLSDTKIAKEFYDTFGYGIDPSSGENMTFTNDDYQPRYGFENSSFFDMDWEIPDDYWKK